MLQGLLKVLLIFLGRKLIAFSFGKEGMVAREKLGKGTLDGYISLVLSLVIIFWLLSIYLLISGTSSDSYMIIFVIVVPVLYAIWCVVARKLSKNYIKNTVNAN